MISGRLKAFVLMAALTLGFDDLYGSRHFPENLRQTLNRVSGFIYNDQFLEAETLIDSLEKSESRGSLGRLFQAILYQSQMMAEESDDLESSFFAVLDTLEDQCHSDLAAGRDSGLAYFCLGHAHAFRALHYSRAGHSWAAVKDGLRARNAYMRGYKVDSTFHDLALGLGSYRYWKTVKTRIISWAPLLFKREGKEGIDLVRRAADSSEIFTDAARSALIWIYINEKRYGEAIRLADMMRRRYPAGLTFIWALGEAAFKLGDYSLAAQNYETILTRLQDRPGNYYNIIEAVYFMGRCYLEMASRHPELRTKVKAMAGDVRVYPIPEKTRLRQKKKLQILQNWADGND